MDEKIIDYNREGLIPGPMESEDSFFSRAEYCLAIKDKLKNSLDLKLGNCAEMVKEACIDTKKTYDINPNWVPITFENHKLSFWHGGCAWIFQLEENTPVCALLQLRKKFYHPKKNRNIIKRKEIIVHELAHVGRMAFEEPKYEEILAYRSSPSNFRAYFGAIAASSKETGVFVLVLILIGLLDLFLVFSSYSEGYFELQWLKLIPVSMVVYGIWRVSKRQKTLNKCLNALEKIAVDSNNTMAIAYRLTDIEIELFALMTPDEIRNYFEKNSESSLRLKLVQFIYFGVR